MASDWPLPLYARPSDDRGPNSVPACATEDSDYPAVNLVNDNPAKPFKSTLQTATITFTFGSPELLEGIVVGNTNRGNTNATLTNGSGLNVSVPIPDNDQDGLPLNAWLDFSAQSAPTRTATVWTLTIPTGTGNAAVGFVCLIAVWREFRLKWGLKVKPRRDVVRHRTFGGSNLRYDKLVRLREITGVVDLMEDELDIRRLEMEAHSDVNPFVVVPDEEVNDAIFCEFLPDTFEYGPDNPGISTMPIRLRERSMGPPLYTV